jgi:dihydrofolate reductase
MPWKIPDDEQYFTDKTKSLGGNVLSGGVTFRTAYKSNPLKDRQNFILTHDPSPIAGVTVVNDLTKFLKDFEDKDLWVAGGSVVFGEVMKANQADELYITHIDAEFGCDQFFPEFEDTYQKIEESDRREQNGFYFTYAVYKRKST